MRLTQTGEQTILVTGAAGFIGYHLSKRLLESGLTIAGVDNCNDYYDPALKRARLNELYQYERFLIFGRRLSRRKLCGSGLC